MYQLIASDFNLRFSFYLATIFKVTRSGRELDGKLAKCGSCHLVYAARFALAACLLQRYDQ